jgi:hypothetical protein
MCEESAILLGPVHIDDIDLTSDRTFENLRSVNDADCRAARAAFKSPRSKPNGNGPTQSSTGHRRRTCQCGRWLP